jgi:CRP-like cAMP-binding protein
LGPSASCGGRFEREIDHDGVLPGDGVTGGAGLLWGAGVSYPRGQIPTGTGPPWRCRCEDLMHDAAPTRNLLLQSIPAADRAAIEVDIELVALGWRSTLHEPTDPTPWVHFPESGVLSLLAVLQDGSAVELGHVGNEGMVDISVFLGLTASESRTVVQVPGMARRIAADRFRQHLAAMPALRTVIGAYVLEFVTMVAQTAACNRMHTLEQRFARWVLMTHDRVAVSSFPITHDFLADMLGASRPKVSRAAAEMRRRGLIRYARGHMEILDRAGLEAVTCECYALILDRFTCLRAAVPAA